MIQLRTEEEISERMDQLWEKSINSDRIDSAVYDALYELYRPFGCFYPDNDKEMKEIVEILKTEFEWLIYTKKDEK